MLKLQAVRVTGATAGDAGEPGDVQAGIICSAGKVVVVENRSRFGLPTRG